jgi:hypothetical protein
VEDLVDPGQNGSSRIGGRARHLDDLHGAPLLVEGAHVGEGPTGVDSDSHTHAFHLSFTLPRLVANDDRRGSPPESNMKY